MAEWFHERYISRDEHQEIVEYYKRLVANLQLIVCDLRTQVDSRNITTLVEHSKRLRDRELGRSPNMEPDDNVILLDFRSPRSKS